MQSILLQDLYSREELVFLKLLSNPPCFSETTKKGLSTKHVKMGLTDLRDSHCVSVVLIKAFSALLLQACLSAIFLLYKRFFPLDQTVIRPLCLMVSVLIVRGNSQIY